MSTNNELQKRMAEQMEFVLSQTPEALQAENVKLRVERDEWHRVAESKQDIIDHMRDANAENAKLRELVEDMLDCIDIQIAFERVPARWMQDEFAGRARELGMEVDG
jgi:uncharacterized protein YigA (DUF484 family)